MRRFAFFQMARELLLTVCFAPLEVSSGKQINAMEYVNLSCCALIGEVFMIHVFMFYLLLFLMSSVSTKFTDVNQLCYGDIIYNII